MLRAVIKAKLFFLIIFFAISASCQEAALPSAEMVLQEKSAEFTYDRFIEDKKTRDVIQSLVKNFIDNHLDAHQLLIFESVPSARLRTFRLVEVFNVVSERSGVYTSQVDLDELTDPVTFRLLFFDFVWNGEDFRLIGIRDGGQHLRQKSAN